MSLNKESLQRMLEENILGYWTGLRDPAGGFFGEADFRGAIHPEAPRGAVLCARIAWSFSASYLALGRKEYLEAAVWAGDYFLRHFIDPLYGGVFWSVDASGQPLECKKQLYAQAFGIYGLSELYLASGEERYRDAAASLYGIIEKHYADHAFGGYTEALARDFSSLKDMSLSDKDINADKTMNSHLHLAEAYANLYRVLPSEGLRKATVPLLELLTSRMVNKEGHLLLYFTKDWSPLPCRPSPGHDIETSWLALECALALGDESLFEELRPRCRRLADAGNTILRPDGSLEGNPEWWVYAETVVGNLWLARYHGETSARERAEATLEYIFNNLVDPSGEWYWSILPDGSPDRSQPKAGFWKCPYHNSRMCLELLRD